MEFRLVYEGPLLAQGAKAAHKWEIRRALHPQLARLWEERPLAAAAERLLDRSPQRGEPSRQTADEFSASASQTGLFLARRLHRGHGRGVAYDC